jgi:hypothetical protein
LADFVILKVLHPILEIIRECALMLEDLDIQIFKLSRFQIASIRATPGGDQASRDSTLHKIFWPSDWMA